MFLWENAHFQNEDILLGSRERPGFESQKCFAQFTRQVAHLINSATGTRTRVARARVEYPNQLDYSGFCWGIRGSHSTTECVCIEPFQFVNELQLAHELAIGHHACCAEDGKWYLTGKGATDKANILPYRFQRIS